MAEKIDVYQMVTNEIVKQLEQGEIPWAKPWKDAMIGAISRSTKKPYSLLNQFLLGKSGEWLTFNQIKDAGGSIKAGEKAHFVVFWKLYNNVVTDDEGNERVKTIPVLRYYNVWHIDQTEGVKARIVTPDEVECKLQPIEKAEKAILDYFARETCRLIIEPSNQAYYRPSTDEVHMPELKQFHNVEEYYSTMFHEITHSTGAVSRLNRDGVVEHTHFGGELYSKEELIAELGAAFMLNNLGLSCERAMTNSAAYIQSWLKALKNDKKLIVTAAGKAETAAKFIMGIK